MTLWSQLDTVEGVGSFDPSLSTGVTIDCDSLTWDMVMNSEAVEDLFGVDAAMMQSQCGGDESRPVPDMLLVPGQSPDDCGASRESSFPCSGDTSSPEPWVQFQGNQMPDRDRLLSAVRQASSVFDVEFGTIPMPRPGPPSAAQHPMAPRSIAPLQHPDGGKGDSMLDASRLGRSMPGSDRLLPRTRQD